MNIYTLCNCLTTYIVWIGYRLTLILELLVLITNHSIDNWTTDSMRFGTGAYQCLFELAKVVIGFKLKVKETKTLCGTEKIKDMKCREGKEPDNAPTKNMCNAL